MIWDGDDDDNDSELSKIYNVPHTSLSALYVTALNSNNK